MTDEDLFRTPTWKPENKALVRSHCPIMQDYISTASLSAAQSVGRLWWVDGLEKAQACKNTRLSSKWKYSR